MTNVDREWGGAEAVEAGDKAMITAGSMMV